MLTEINGYWQDENFNTWATRDYTKDAAEAAAASLTDCSFCRNCENCTDCEYCSECSGCTNCAYCRSCSELDTGAYCEGCNKSHQVLFSDFVNNAETVAYSSTVRNARTVNHAHTAVSEDASSTIVPVVTINNLPIPGLPLRSINLIMRHGVQVIESIDGGTNVVSLEEYLKKLEDNEPDAVKYAARRNYAVIALRLYECMLQLIEAYRPKEEQ